MLPVVGCSCEKWNMRIPGPWQPGQTGSGRSTYLLVPWFPLLRERSWQSWPLAALAGAPTTGSSVVFSVVIAASTPINVGSTTTGSTPTPHLPSPPSLGLRVDQPGLLGVSCLTPPAASPPPQAQGMMGVMLGTLGSSPSLCPVHKPLFLHHSSLLG
jgi:hypothetical protein